MSYETTKESFVSYLLTDLADRYPQAFWTLDGVAKNLFVSIRDGGALIVISHVKDDWTVVRKVNDAAGTVDLDIRRYHRENVRTVLCNSQRRIRHFLRFWGIKQWPNDR